MVSFGYKAMAQQSSHTPIREMVPTKIETAGAKTDRLRDQSKIFVS